VTISRGTPIAVSTIAVIQPVLSLPPVQW